MIISQYINKEYFIETIKNLENHNQVNIELCYLFFNKFEIVFKSTFKVIYIISPENKTYKTKFPCIVNNNEIYHIKNIEKISYFLWNKYTKLINYKKTSEKEIVIEKIIKTEKINQIKSNQTKKISEEKKTKLPPYKLKEFWKYNINPITGFEPVKLYSNKCELQTYYLDKY